MSLRYIVAGTAVAAGAYYAPAAYKVYEAESAVTAAETALSALNARIKSYDTDIARAKATVTRGMDDINATRSAAARAAEEVVAARKAVEAARAKLDDKMAAQRKLSLAAEAIQLDVDKARGVVERRKAEKEASAVEHVRATMEVEKARAAAAKAADQISLPPVFTR